MKTTIQILIILFISQSVVSGQIIKSIDEKAYGNLVIEYQSERQYKKQLKRTIFYSEHYGLPFDCHKIFEFDKNGNLITEKNFNEQGEISSTRKYYFNESNLLLRNDNRYFDKPKSNYSIIYHFNENNKIIESIDSSSRMIKTVSVTYPKPDLKKMVTIINNKKVDTWIIHFDSISLIEKTTAYDQNDSLFITTKRYYDSQGNLLKEINFNLNQQPIITKSFEYDSSNVRIYEKTEFHKDGRIDEIKRIIDTSNQTKDIKGFTNGKLQHWTRIYFDINENEIKTEYLENDGSVTFQIENEYTYDEKGNWIEKRESKDDKVYTVIYREIEYYN